VYIGTDLGVFASYDKGLNWGIDMLYNENEGPCNVEVDELFWQGTDYLIAATHGRGMYMAMPYNEIYVDKNAAVGGNGSQASPFNNVTDAVNHADYNSRIYIKSNTYNEPGTILFYKKGMVRATNGTSVIK
jgi:hypothetical protein